MSEPAIRIAIVGGGLTGALLCMQLLRSHAGCFDIHLYEKAPQRFCRGVAYSSALPYQLLNVPAGKMSLFPAEPHDFIDWLAARGGAHGASDYVARHLFGDYVSARFTQITDANRRHTLTRINREVVDIAPKPHGLRVDADGAAPCVVDKVYLCTGNFPPADLPGLDPRLRASERYIAMPWDGRYLARVQRNDTVLVVGTGLSMIDQLMSLQDCNDFSGQVIALSRRGLLPLQHAESSDYTPEAFNPDTVSLKAVYAWLQTETRKAEQAGSCFRQVIDALRPQLPSIWNSLPTKDRQRFMRHLRPFWEIHRHRIPSTTAAHIQTLLRVGKLRVIAGRIAALAQLDLDSVLVDYLPRGATAPQQLTANWIINCTGPQTDYRQLQSPLYHALQYRGLLCADASRLGLVTTLTGQALCSDGRIEPRLTLVGPPAKASLWESTALQEIRQQVQTIVRGLEKEMA